MGQPLQKRPHINGQQTTSVKVECTDPMLTPNSVAISRTVIRRSCMISVHICSITFSFWLVDGLPECGCVGAGEQLGRNVDGTHIAAGMVAGEGSTCSGGGTRAEDLVKVGWSSKVDSRG